MKHNDNTPKKILVIRTDRIGDLILSTPVLATLRANFPSSYIAVMISPSTKELLEGNPNADEIIIYDKEKEHRGWLATINFARQLARRKFDVAVVLHSTNRVNIVAFLAGIPRRIGYARRAGFLLTDRFKYLKREGKKHEIDYCLDLLAPLGVAKFERALYVPADPGAAQKIDNLLAEYGISKLDNFITLIPFTSSPSRCWPAERFAEVADSLADEFGLNIVITSNQRFARLSKAVAGRMKHKAADLSGRTTLRELIALLSRARFVISNDSGPVHIACAVGTPVVSIFGRNEQGLSPARWGPVGKLDIALQKDVGCKECPADNCAVGFKCLDAITVEDVLNAARTIQRNIGS